MDTDYDSAVATAISRQEATATSLSHSNQTVQYNYGLFTRVYFAHTVLSCCQMIVHKEGQNVQIQNSTSGSRHVGWQERVKGKISVFLHPNLWVPFFSSNFKLKVFSVCVWHFRKGISNFRKVNWRFSTQFILNVHETSHSKIIKSSKKKKRLLKKFEAINIRVNIITLYY